MIERYANSNISSIWSKKNQYRVWKNLELTYLKYLLDDLTLDPNLITLNITKIETYEKETKHELVAFLKELTFQLDSLYPEKAYTNYLHYGLTSSDIIDSANAILIKQSIAYLRNTTNVLLNTLNTLIDKYKDLDAVGRTHGKHAEPIKFVSRFEHFKYELKIGMQHLLIAKDGMPGKMTGPVGTSSFVNKKAAALTLSDFNLSQAYFSTQVVSRMHYVQVIYACSLIMAVYERFCTQIRLMSINEIDEVQEGFSPGQTGSSAMPHKNNPIISENITGLSRLVRSNLQAAFENNNLWFERDISHSSVERIIIPDTFHLVATATNKINNYLLPRLVINEHKITSNLQNADVSSHEELLRASLTTKRLEAYKQVQDESFRRNK
jgi:adenylosuccinate lyase